MRTVIFIRNGKRESLSHQDKRHQLGNAITRKIVLHLLLGNF
nr:MAG TPA: hypothetical protein [Caudoviricetes sp.]